MFIQKLVIKGLRGFEEEGIINLAIPNGNYGSGLTILVGPNNSGKSTIIEAFSALSSALSETPKYPSFTEEMRNKKDDEILIKAIDIRNGFYEIYNSPSLRSETGARSNNFGSIHRNIFVLPSRRSFEPYYDGDPGEMVHRDNYTDSKDFPPLRGSKMSHFFSRISGANSRANNRKEKFDEVMREILDPLPEWKIERNGSGQYYMRIFYGGISHISDGAGDGLLSLFFIIDALYDSDKNGIVVIDEPELSLHPSLQKKVSRLFADYAKDRQLIIATHSSYFIDWEAIINGANIIRVSKEGTKTVVYPKESLSAEVRKKINNLMDDNQNLHTFGLDAKEVFFLNDNIILVEGQQDVFFYKNWVLPELGKDKMNCEFYGWGVGGASKMGTIARLLLELGFKKVIGILDNDKEGKREKEKLEKEYNNYNFFIIPTEDVIDKKSENAKPLKNGLLIKSNKHYKIKDKYKSDLIDIFNNIGSLFND
jgi:predicted ATP-dependent endonuclease of OLD family